MDDEDFHAELFKDAPRLHGVPYLSRDNQTDEIGEMERFIRAAAADGLETCLRGLFYDSRACFCDIGTIDGLTAADPEGERLNQLAAAYISQFHLLGAIGHRR